MNFVKDCPTGQIWLSDKNFCGCPDGQSFSWEKQQCVGGMFSSFS
jgi:hypothetical protein